LQLGSVHARLIKQENNQLKTEKQKLNKGLRKQENNCRSLMTEKTKTKIKAYASQKTKGTPARLLARYYFIMYYFILVLIYLV
jgi:uncharacterized membrane protein